MNSGWITIHRKLLDWEWFDDSNTLHVFIYCLLRSNHKLNMWRGNKIHPGQFITSQKHISEATGLSVRKVRTSLDKLKLTGELTVKTTSKFSIISITNWISHQAVDTQKASKASLKRQTNDRQATTNNNDNNVNNKDKKGKNSRFTPPDINQVSEYLNERGASHIDGQQFIDHHQTRGWIMSNRQKMKDWKAAVRTWISNDKKFNTGVNHDKRDTRNRAERCFDAIRNLPDD
jgi:hypothetical protein